MENKQEKLFNDIINMNYRIQGLAGYVQNPLVKIKNDDNFNKMIQGMFKDFDNFKDEMDLLCSRVEQIYYDVQFDMDKKIEAGFRSADVITNENGGGFVTDNIVHYDAEKNQFYIVETCMVSTKRVYIKPTSE